MTKRKQKQPKRNDDAIDFDYDDVQHLQQQTRLKQQQQQRLASDAQLTDTEAAKNDSALSAPDNPNPSEANETMAAAQSSTEMKVRAELVKQEGLLSSITVKSSECKRMLRQLSAEVGSVVSCLDENSNSNNDHCHVNTDEVDNRFSASVKANLLQMESIGSDEKDFLQYQKMWMVGLDEEKAMESDKMTVKLISSPLQFDAKAKLPDEKPGQPNKTFLASVNPTCNEDVADWFDDDSVKSNDKEVQPTEIGFELGLQNAISDSVLGHTTEEVLPNTITDFLQKQKDNRSIYSFGERHWDDFEPTSAEESANNVKKLESFVASVESCHLKSELLDQTTSSSSSSIPFHVNRCCQMLDSHHLDRKKIVSLVQQRLTAITSATVIAADRPLDLSNKTNSNDSPLVTSYSSSMSFNAINSDSSQLSSLAHLEEKFGIKSAILDQVGVWPSNTVISSKSRLHFPDDHCGLTGQEDGPHFLPSKVNTSKAIMSFSKDRSPGEMFDVDTSYKPTSLIRNNPVSSSGLLRCGTASETLCQPTVGQHLSAHDCSMKADVNAGALASEMVRGQSQRQQDVQGILRCIECGLLFQSLSELTVHMFQMEHYLNLVHRDGTIHQRSSSVCSESTLDSLDRNESSSEQSACDDKDKLLNRRRGPLWQHDLVVLSHARESAFSNSASKDIQPLKMKLGHKRSRLISLQRTDSLRKVRRLDKPDSHTATSAPYNEHRMDIKQVSLTEDYCSSSSDANSESSSPFSGNDFEASEGQSRKSICIDREQPDNGRSTGSSRHVSALVAMQNFVQQSFIHDQTPFLSKARTICANETLSQS